MQNILYFLKKYLKDMIILILIMCSFGLSIFLYFYEENDNSKKEIADAPIEMEKKEENASEEVIHVDIKGAVKNPGVYELKSGTYVYDVINLAGGFMANAYKNSINLSKKLSDEMVIYVYTTSDYKTSSKPNTVIKNDTSTCKVPTYNISECVINKESIIVPGESDNKDKTDSNTSNIININLASIKELTSLSGIGDAKAKLIVEYREQNGNFKSIEEIKNVKGIGASIFEKIKNSITV